MEFGTTPAAAAVLNGTTFTKISTNKNRGHMFKGKVIYQVLENFSLSANDKYVFYKKKGSRDRSITRAVFDIYVTFVVSNSDLNLEQYEMKWQFFSVVFETGVSF